jgi:hypothetical protein
VCAQNAIFCSQVFVLEKQFLIDQTGDVGEQAYPFVFFHLEPPSYPQFNSLRFFALTTTGREITIPLWFVADEHGIWLLPVSGSDTRWYRNVEKNGVFTIRGGGEQPTFACAAPKDPQAVNKVVERFREKYSPEEIKRWYKGLDVAVQIPLAPATSES